MIFDMTKRKGGGGGDTGWTNEGIAAGAEPYGDIVIDMPATSAIRQGAFYGRPITSLSIINGNNINGNAVNYCNLLTRVFAPLSILSSSSAISYCTALLVAVIGGIGGGAYAMRGNSALKTVDIQKNAINGQTWNGCTSLETLILRNTAIQGLVNVSAFTGTPFASGGTGGTIYIPKSLYDHLGDGTSSDYKAATNWATVNGYGTITWKSIESTHTDPNAPIDLTLYYADGTLIPAT